MAVPHVAVIFTTTIDGQDLLYEDVHDTCPFLSRCVEIALSRRGLSEAFAARAQQIARAEGPDGAPLERDVRLAKASTRRVDETFKPEAYACIGVRELFLYDPAGDYLDPMLQGFRFTRGRKTRIRTDASDSLACRQLGLKLRLVNGDLRMFDARTGKVLHTEAEAECTRAETERAAREAAEEELRKLREQLARKRKRDA